MGSEMCIRDRTYTDQGITKTTEISIIVIDKRANHENHNKYSLVKEVPATCDANGTEAYYKCDECGRIFADKEGKKELEKPVVIPKTGHSYKTVVVKATKTKNGYAVKRCSKCNAETAKTVIYKPKTVKLSATAFAYTGKTQKPVVVIKDTAGKVITSANYDVYYDSESKTVGKHTVKIVFKKNYSGTVVRYYTIIPTTTKITKLENAANGIKLTWAKKSYDGYRIYRNINGKGTKLVKTISNASITSWVDTSARANGSKYAYVVCPYKNVKNSVYKSSMKEVKRCIYIAGGKLISIGNPSYGKLSVKWTKNDKATGYQVQYSTKSSFTSAVTSTYRKNNIVSASYGKLKKGTTYYVRVRAYKTGKSTFYGAWSPAKAIKIGK